MASIERISSPPRLPIRPHDGHKGTFGRVLIVGGHEEMIGAPAFAGSSALRMGSGLVQIATPGAILHSCLSITPELIGLWLNDDGASDALVDAAYKADAIVIGPGMGQSPATRARLIALASLDKPMIIDADGLNLLAAEKHWPAWFAAKAVLTPHPGEMSRLGKLIDRTEVPKDEAGRIDIAVQAAIAFGQVIVLKGSGTVVTDGHRVYVNDTGDSTLSKAGTGDVLSGMIGCLLAQKLDRFDAAALAVHLHGMAGELAGKKLGQRSALARDVIDSIADAIGAYESITRT